jgi:hypothetical protein
LKNRIPASNVVNCRLRKPTRKRRGLLGIEKNAHFNIVALPWKLADFPI